MINYNNSKIYKIVDNTNNNIYIGSTTEKYLSSRLSKHLGNYKRFLEGKVKTCCSCKLIFENNNFYIELLELVNCNSKDELHKKERYYIENNVCINKNIPGRTNKEWKDDNKEKIKEWKKEYKQKNKEKIKEYQKELRIYLLSWGGDIRYYNNLLKIDVNLFA